MRLPKLLQADRGAKPLNQAWLTEAGLIKVLNGQLPEQSEVIPHNQLFHSESRLGIVRDRERRATKEGLLYQAQHLRFEKEIKIGVEVSGISEGLHPTTQQCTRFGAEGHLGESLIEVKAGQIRFLTSPCQSQYCIHAGWLTNNGEVVACLPNQVTIQLRGNENLQFDSIAY